MPVVRYDEELLDASRPLHALRDQDLAAMTVWTIGIRRVDESDLDGELTLLDSAGNAYWFEGGVVIQTDPTGFGDFNTERVIPWARIIEYRKESK